MRSSSSLLGRVLFWIASEMLDILTKILKIIFNQNLFPCLLCDPWIIYWSTIKKENAGLFCISLDLHYL